jgi:PAS domain S-box-containing protein
MVLPSGAWGVRERRAAWLEQRSGAGWPPPAVAVGLAGAILVADVFVRLDIAVSVLYVVVVILAAPALRRRSILVVGVACIGLSIIGFAVNHAEASPASVGRWVVVVAAIGIATVLTARNRAAAEAARDEASLLNLTQDAVFVRDWDGKVTFWNAGAEALYSWSRADMTGQLAHDRIGTSFPIPRPEIDAALQAYGHWEGELIAVRRDGRQVQVAARWALRRDESRRPITVLETHTDITERKEAERALRRSEEDLRAIIDTIPTHIWTSGVDGSDAVFNRRRLEYTGPGVDWYGIVHPDERAEHDAVWAAAVRSGGSFQFEQRLLAADGSYRWFLGRAEPLRDEQGNIIRWIGINIDIEERKQTEARLRRAEEDLQEIVDTIPTHVWTALPDGSSPYLNRRRIEYSGFDTDFETVVHPDDRPEQLRAWLTAVQIGDSFENEQRLRAADGSYRWFLSRAEPLRSASGEIVKWIGINIDIDDLRRAQERIRRNEQDLRDAIDTIPTHVWSTLPDGSGEYLNRRRLEYAGVSMDIEGLIHPDDRVRYDGDWAAAIGAGAFFEGEYRLRRNDGAYRWFLSRAEPLRDDGGRIVRWFGTNTDIDNLRRAEQALQRAQAELAHVTRVATLGELTASIAHEVNQPLAGIVTNGEACLRWLRRDQPDLEEAQRSVERIIGDGRRAGQVVRRLRALARKDEPDWRPCDLNEVVEESLPLVAQEMTRRRISLDLSLSPGLPRVLGDRVQLQQVVINLIVNGIQAMAEVTDRRRTLTVSSWLNEESAGVAACVVLVVRDSGPGVDPAVGDRLFDPFFTTRADGMGMGLSICRSIVEAHGGRISVDRREASDRGNGAAFQLALPAHAQVHQ